MPTPILSSHLSTPALLQVVRAGGPVEIADVLNRLPVSAFAPSDTALAGVKTLVEETSGAAQATVLKVALARGSRLFQKADTSLHLFLAGRVGTHGNAEGVSALESVWEVGRLTKANQQALWRLLAGKALLHQNEEALVAGWERNPDDKNRSDALRLAWHRANSSATFEWGWQWSPRVPWHERVECLFLALRRAWPVQPDQYPIARPQVVLDFSSRVLDSLPWEQPSVPWGIRELFDAPQSPFAVLWEHEYHWDPRLRQEALLGCLQLTRSLENRGVELRWGSPRWEEACVRHGRRLRDSGIRLNSEADVG